MQKSTNDWENNGNHKNEKIQENEKMQKMQKNEVLIVDFGSQYTFLIAKTIRRLGYYCEIKDPSTIDTNVFMGIKMVILSGGPQSVFSYDSNDLIYNETVEKLSSVILDPQICVIGICYGMQYVCHYLGGKVEEAPIGEFGKTAMRVNPKYVNNDLVSWLMDHIENNGTKTKKRPNLLHRFSRFKAKVKNLKDSRDESYGDESHGDESHGDEFQKDKFQKDVWMSHQDHVVVLPESFQTLAHTRDCPNAYVYSQKYNVYGMQFHPEVSHTYKGSKYLKVICKKYLTKNWKTVDMVDDCRSYIEKTVPYNANVIVALSGGVDSLVTATLLRNFLGPQRVKCVMIDHGMLRKNEVQEIVQTCVSLGIELLVADQRREFLAALRNISEPEQKRKIIGRTFIESFETAIFSFSNSLSLSNNSLSNNSFDKPKWMLAQGTIYPDVVESSKGGANKDLIKSHHNVGGLPERMGLELVEPLRHMFKNEVREVGKKLNIPLAILQRHPFPGPGLAIRIVGEVTEEKLQILREADAIFMQSLQENDLYHRIDQAYVGLLNTKSVGVVGDQRRYGYVACLRAVNTSDFMTASVYSFSMEYLEEISTKIVNSVQGISRVMYDITNKPPSTIELE